MLDDIDASSPSSVSRAARSGTSHREFSVFIRKGSGSKVNGEGRVQEHDNVASTLGCGTRLVHYCILPRCSHATAVEPHPRREIGQI